MSKLTFLLAGAAILVMAGFKAQANADVEVRYVFVADEGLKPSVAVEKGKYEFVRLTMSDGKTNPLLLCDDCRARTNPSAFIKLAASEAAAPQAVGRPAQEKQVPLAKGRILAFICEGCDQLCWFEGVTRVVFSDEVETEALKKIEAELRKHIPKPGKLALDVNNTKTK
jgi:hypothetical protein